MTWQLKGRSDGIPRLASQYLVRQAFGPVSVIINISSMKYRKCQIFAKLYSWKLHAMCFKKDNTFFNINHHHN